MLAKRGSVVKADVVLGECTADDAGELVGKCLAAKAFCVINPGLSSDVLAQASSECVALDNAGQFRRPSELIVEGLFGFEGSAKIAHIEAVDSGRVGALGKVDSAMSTVNELVRPYAGLLDTGLGLRTNAVLNQTGVPEGEPPELREAEAGRWLADFRDAVMMCVIAVGPEYGTLELQPQAIGESQDTDENAFEVEMEAGTMCLLRCDTLLAKHAARGKAHLLSCFFMCSVDFVEKRNLHLMTPTAKVLSEWVTERLDKLKDEEEDDRKLDVPTEWMIAMNHQCFKGQHMSVRGVSCRMPVTWEPDIHSMGMVTGPDYATEIPLQRWDHTFRYDADPEGWRGQKTFAKHCTFTDGIDLFDNKQFGITPAESRIMDPLQRIVLECGYEALYSAGYKKGKIINSLGGMYLGTGSSTSDFSYVDKCSDSSAEGSFGATGGSAAISANRFNFCLGMKGPSIAINAEDASVHVTASLGAEGLMKKGRLQVNDFSVVGGLHVNMAAHFWPMKQAAGMLSATGRCLTFDVSGDGFGHGDNCGNLVLRSLTETRDGETILIDPELAVGVLAASAVNCNGRNSVMAAPNGPCMQEVMSNALRGAGLSGFDIDLAECFGNGDFLSDAIEVTSWSRILRLADNCDDMPLALSAAKTSVGNGCFGSGIAQLIRSIYSNTRGAISPCIHMHQLNPHIEAWDQPINFHEELTEFRLASSYVASLGRGIGGTNSIAIAWGQMNDSRLRKQQSHDPLSRLIFWPGGGGMLDSDKQPKKGFNIAGTFSNWQPEPMEMEDGGIYSFTLTLGENRWEQFQIWLDGDSKKCLHPNYPQAGRNSKVEGPDPTPEGFTWFIEGRTETVFVGREGVEALEDGAGEADDPASGQVSLREQTTKDGQYELGSADRGVIGARYKVRLHVAGKYRMVDWERITGRPEEAGEVDEASSFAADLPTAEYFITSDWNGWGFTAMSVESISDGNSVFSADVRLLRRGGEFQIVRNRDWEQILYPPEEAMGQGDEVYGPDDGSYGRAWYLDGKAGDNFTIKLERSREQGFDTKKVSWTTTGNAAISPEEQDEVSRVRIAAFGSWDEGARLRQLVWNGEFYVFYVQLRSDLKENFQLVVDMNWDRIFHPSVKDANPSMDYEIIGPSFGDGSSRGYNWTLGTEGYEKMGDVFEINVHVDQVRQKVMKVEWKRLQTPGSEEVEAARAEGLVLQKHRVTEMQA